MLVTPRPKYFPPADSADADGLLALGGELTSEWLLDAYEHGIFPWPLGEGTLAWWSPDPRGVLELDAFHVSRRLERTRRSGRFEITVDREFEAVVQACASAQDRAWATWITPSLRRAYARLHRLGLAHSVEVWGEGRLAGGVYGVALGGFFAGESMFYDQRDASKVALAHLVERLRDRGFVLFDVQQVNPHTRSLGAVEIARSEYLRRLREAVRMNVAF